MRHVPTMIYDLFTSGKDGVVHVIFMTIVGLGILKSFGYHVVAGKTES
jgi:hypothetical protein